MARLFGYAMVFSRATLVAGGWRRIHRARRKEKLMAEGAVQWRTIASVAAFPIIVLFDLLDQARRLGHPADGADPAPLPCRDGAAAIADHPEHRRLIEERLASVPERR